MKGHKLSAAHKKSMAEGRRKAKEAKKKMGLFGKKQKETKTFVEGQLQQGPELPEPPRADPVQPAPSIPRAQYQEIPRAEPEPEQQPPPNNVRLVPGFYYWIDEVGDICFKQKK